MIGQENIKNKFIYLIKENKIPKVIIINAPKGYGKKEFVKWLSNESNIPYKLYGNKIDEVRKAIEQSQNEFTNQFYVFEGLEQNNGTQNKNAQNAILKFLEEPPQNAFIILLCNDYKYLLTTLQNRGIRVDFDGYSKEELKLFNDNEIALNIYKSPLDLINTKNINLNELLEVTNKIIDKLDLAGVCNALNLNSYIKYKDSEGKYNKEEGYDLDLFVKALRYSFVQKYKNNKDDKIRIKFNILQTSINHIKVNHKYFMDNFILKNYMENKAWKLPI